MSSHAIFCSRICSLGGESIVIVLKKYSGEDKGVLVYIPQIKNKTH